MELLVGERIMLGVLIAPIAADVVTLRLVRHLQEELSFSDEETEELKFENEEGRVRWSSDAPQTKEFDFSKVVLSIIKAQFEKLSREKQLTLTQLDLHDKFCPEEEGQEE